MHLSQSAFQRPQPVPAPPENLGAVELEQELLPEKGGTS
jgi:hypothetical protein